jgi:hypothetical protein
MTVYGLLPVLGIECQTGSDRTSRRRRGVHLIALGRNRPSKDERRRLTAVGQTPQSNNNRSAVSLDYFFVAFLAATFFTAFLGGAAFAGEPAIKRLSAVTPFFFNASTNQSGRLPRPDQV